jgi:AcrR family transcriptional regulator
MSEEKREKILTAAKNAFAQKGFAAVGIREIAKAAGLNSATLYHYFKNKDEIYSEILEQTFNKIIDILKEISTLELEEGELVKVAVGRYIDFINENRGVLKILVHELNLETEMVVRVAKRFYGNFFSITEELVAAREKSSGKRVLDPKHLLISGIGLCTINFILAPLLNILEGKNQLSHEMLEERKEAVTDLMLYGILGKSGQEG